jgi:serine/threonine-protein kinase
VPTGINLFSTPAVANGVVYIGDVIDGDGVAEALDAATGARLWYYPTPNGRVDSSPVVVDGVLYVGSQSHNVYAFALPD